jgi:nitrite reductase/ring-hydroxylating ferredoxin subunit
VSAEGVEVGLLRVGGTIVAFENVCPHQGGPVCQGEVLGRVEAVLDDQKRVVQERVADARPVVVCPWHGHTFDAATGECITDPRIHLRRWRAVERDGRICLAGRGQRPAAEGSDDAG